MKKVKDFDNEKLKFWWKSWRGLWHTYTNGVKTDVCEYED